MEASGNKTREASLRTSGVMCCTMTFTLPIGTCVKAPLVHKHSTKLSATFPKRCGNNLTAPYSTTPISYPFSSRELERHNIPIGETIIILFFEGVHFSADEIGNLAIFDQGKPLCFSRSNAHFLQPSKDDV